jgi:hypothetical protein
LGGGDAAATAASLEFAVAVFTGADDEGRSLCAGGGPRLKRGGGVDEDKEEGDASDDGGGGGVVGGMVLGAEGTEEKADLAMGADVGEVGGLLSFSLSCCWFRFSAGGGEDGPGVLRFSSGRIGELPKPVLLLLLLLLLPLLFLLLLLLLLPLLLLLLLLSLLPVAIPGLPPSKLLQLPPRPPQPLRWGMFRRLRLL